MGMLYFLPDSNDTVDPTYDFDRESRSSDRVPRDDLYTHEVLDRPHDGILISYGAIRGGVYSAGARRRLLRSGVREFYRARSWTTFMGDCGAFSYIREDEPPYTVAEVAEFYARIGVDLGIAVDHIVPGYQDTDGLFGPPSTEVQRRYDLTLELAADFLAASTPHDYAAVGAVHGWSPSSYAAAAYALQRMGYRYLAIGGLVPLTTDQVNRVLDAVSAVRLPETRLHLLGMARRGHHAAYASKGVASIDSTSPLRVAFMDKRKNYYIGDESFAALRIPDSCSPRVRGRIMAGEIDHEHLLQLEARAIDTVDGYAHGTCSADSALEAVLEYQSLHSPMDDRREDYRRTLEARPWERCRCPICSSLGHHVILFRGAERNLRRGMHNVAQFYRGMLREIGEPDLVLVGCGAAKADGPAPARDIYTGSAFRANAKIAEGYRAPMAILSAKYGVLDPSTVIERYDATLKGASKDARDEWDAGVVTQLRDCLPSGGRIVALAGSDYLGWVDDARAVGFEVKLPLAGKTLGERQAIAAGTDNEVMPPVRGGQKIAWDFFWTTFRSSLKGDAFVAHWTREGARHGRLSLPSDTPLSEAIQTARVVGLFGKGTARTGVFEVQNDHGIYWAPEGYLNLGKASPRRVRFITWEDAESAEQAGQDHIDHPPGVAPC